MLFTFAVSASQAARFTVPKGNYKQSTFSTVYNII